MAKEQENGLSARVERMVAPMKIELDKITRTKSILNANQVQKIFNTTNTKYVYKRPAKGGGQWNYVRTSYVRRTLDGIFGFNWDFEIVTPDQVAFEMAVMTGYISVRGRLTMRTTSDGVEHTIVREQYGRAEVKFLTDDMRDADGHVVTETYYDKYKQKEMTRAVKVRKIDPYTNKPIPLDFGNDLKAATSDALKKCAAQLGVAADVYDPDEFIPYEIAGSDEADERAKNAKKLAKQATDLLEQQGDVVPPEEAK